MKKAVALFTIMALLLSLPAAAFAADDKADNLESVILKVREKLEIPEEYNEFTSNMRTDGDGTMTWGLQWYYEKGDEYWNRGYIYVDATDTGFIRSYSKYNGDGKYSEYVKIPSVPKEKADEMVKGFISRVCPEIEAELDWQEPAVSSGMYSYTFTRKVNGISMPGNRASFQVDGTTGEITNYYADWVTNLEFPSPEKAISPEEAQKLFAEHTPLDLEYRLDQDGKVYLQYTRSREKGYMFINALTGEVQKPENSYGIYGYGPRYAEDAGMMAKSALRPEEQKEVDNIAGTITVEQAEKMLREIKELDFDEKYKLSGSYLSQGKDPYTGEATYHLSLYFTYLKTDEELTEEKIRTMIAAGEGDGYANATFNAKTGEITSFSSNKWNTPMPLSKESKEENKEAKAKELQSTAYAFLLKMQPEKMGSTKYVPTENYADTLTYNYSRVENGVYFANDYIGAAVNAENSKIMNYFFNWTENVDIPSTEGIIGADRAHEILFANGAFNMEYILNGKSIVLAYKLPDYLPYNIDAVSGELIDWARKAYVEQKAPAYNDIEGHFSETAVKELSRVGVFLSGESFLPDSNILQRDYALLLSKLGKYYYDSSNIDTVYSYLIKEGIMDESEKDPEGSVKREDAVKYLLRYLGYKSFAEIPGIFKCDFEDADEISPELIGYAAIAQGLGVVNGSDGKFMPKEILSKGEAAVLIYNCLKANLY